MADCYLTPDGTSAALPDPAARQQVKDDDSQYVFHSWSAQQLIDPPTLAGGRGAIFWDYDGKEYLDFSSQLVNLNLGHQHPALIAAIHQQADRLATVAPSVANDVRGELARRIVTAAPGDMAKVFFTNGGADANEHAVRMARLHTGRRKVLSTYRSYHGATATAITLSGDPRRWRNEPADPSVVHFIGPYPYRSPFHAETEEQETERALEHLQSIIELEGPETVAAIIMETVVGTNGILVPPPGYLSGVREICDQYGIVWIADEVMAGFGRTGTLFAVENFGANPDLITFAKGVNSGYVPLGGVVISADIAADFNTDSYPGGLTYSGHPLACAVGVATFDVLEREHILAHVQHLSADIVAPRLTAMLDAHPCVGEVRGLGLFWAIELVKDKQTREPLVDLHGSGPAMSAFTASCLAGGLTPFIHGNRTHIVPPLVITDEQLERGLDVIDTALSVVDRDHLN